MSELNSTKAKAENLDGDNKRLGDELKDADEVGKLQQAKRALELKLLVEQAT